MKAKQIIVLIIAAAGAWAIVVQDKIVGGIVLIGAAIFLAERFKRK